MLRRLHALWLLGWSFLLTLLRVYLRIGTRRGYGAFLRLYQEDGLRPLDDTERHTLNGAGRCIACSRCERGDGPVRQRHGAVYPGLMSLVLAASRSSPDFIHGAIGWGVLSQEELQRREALCPVGVPIAALGQLMRRERALAAQASASAHPARTSPSARA